MKFKHILTGHTQEGSQDPHFFRAASHWAFSYHFYGIIGN